MSLICVKFCVPEIYYWPVMSCVQWRTSSRQGEASVQAIPARRAVSFVACIFVVKISFRLVDQNCFDFRRRRSRKQHCCGSCAWNLPASSYCLPITADELWLSLYLSSLEGADGPPVWSLSVCLGIYSPVPTASYTFLFPSDLHSRPVVAIPAHWVCRTS